MPIRDATDSQPHMNKQRPTKAEADEMKDIPVDNLRAKQDEEGNSTSSKNIVCRNDEAQAGIKNIGGISMTRTEWGLIAAYARYATHT